MSYPAEPGFDNPAAGRAVRILRVGS